MNDNIDVSPQNEKPRRINKYVLLAGVAIVAFVVMYLLFSSPGKKSTSIEQVKPNNAATTQNTLGNDERLKRLNEDAEKTKEKETIIQKPIKMLNNNRLTIIIMIVIIFGLLDKESI